MSWFSKILSFILSIVFAFLWSGVIAQYALVPGSTYFGVLALVVVVLVVVVLAGVLGLGAVFLRGAAFLLPLIPISL